MDADQGRGEPMRAHRTAGAWRATLAAAMLVLSVVAFAVAGWLLARQLDGDQHVSYRAIAVPTVIGAGALVVGVVRLVQAIGRRGERFELYPDGLLHRYRGRAEFIEWSRVTAVLVDGAPRPSGLRHALGLDIRCRVRRQGGPAIRFDGLTEAAGPLAQHIAQQAGLSPQPFPR